MASHIQELSTAVRSKLRSGITITSVSQCVEELVLNAVDSGATNIAVRVDLGIFRIQVVDNGKGISEQDMKIIGTRYATSKCHNLEDLKTNLTKYGYRGEALASIVHVSGIVDISSRHKKSTKTIEKLFTYGKGKPPSLSKHSRPSCGTTITIQDFMYNMPVRRKLIKEAIDIENIKSQIERIMLISHNVSVSLKNDRNNCYILQIQKSNSSLNSFVQVFGDEHETNMAEVFYSIDQFEIKGYISTQPYQTKNLQFIYINKRSVLQSKIHALLNDLISRSSIIRGKILPNSVVSGPGKIPSSPPKGLRLYPIYILNIVCPRNEYDICLEPKKTLVEFRDWDKVLLCVEEMVLKFIKEENLIISLDDRFRRSEKEVSFPDFETPIPHSSQAAALQVFSNTKGNGEQRHHERKMTTSDVKHAVFGRPARRNKRLSSGDDKTNGEDNDKERVLLKQDQQNEEKIAEMEDIRSLDIAKDDKDLLSANSDSSEGEQSGVKNIKRRSSLGALKQALKEASQSSITNQPNNNNDKATKTKLSSLQKLRLVSETSREAMNKDFITPTNKNIPSVSTSIRNNQSAEETIDIYDNSRKLLLPEMNIPSNGKTHSLSSNLSQDFKEAVKKKNILKSLHSFKFDKSVRNNEVNESGPICAKRFLQNNNNFKKDLNDIDTQSKSDNDQSLNRNSLSSKEQASKKNFFDFDKTEEFSLDSIDVNDLLQDNNTFYNFEMNVNKPTLSTSMNPDMYKSKKIIREKKFFSDEMEVDVYQPEVIIYDNLNCQSDFQQSCERKDSSAKIVSEKNLMNIRAETLDKRENETLLTQPFPTKENNPNIFKNNTIDIDNVKKRLKSTKPFSVNDPDSGVQRSACDQFSVAQNLTSGVEIVTHTQSFNVTGSCNSTRRSFQDTDMMMCTQNFDVRENSLSGSDVSAAMLSKEGQDVGSKPSKSNTKLKETQEMSTVPDNLHADSCAGFFSKENNTNIVIKSQASDKTSEPTLNMKDAEVRDIPDSIDQIQSLSVESNGSSLDMNIELKLNEESTHDSLSSEVKKNIINFVSSSDKTLSTTVSLHSISESIKRYSESSQLRFEGKILHIGPKVGIEKNNKMETIKESVVISNGIAESSSGNLSNGTDMPTINVTSEVNVIDANPQPLEATVNSTLHVANGSSTVETSFTNTWKRVTNGDENIYVNIRTGNTSFIAPPPDPVPKWKAGHSMGSSTLKIPITDEFDPLGVSRPNRANQCFSLSHGFDSFLPTKRKHPPEKTTDASKIKKISSSHFRSVQDLVQDGSVSGNIVREMAKGEKEVLTKLNSFRDKEKQNEHSYISARANEALNEFLKENLLLDDEFSKWGNNIAEKTNDLLNLMENTEKFAMDAQILGSDDDGRDHQFNSNVKCYDIVHPYKFSRELLKRCKVYGQVDKKFIAIALPFSSDTPHLIVVVDQHAADERVQLEKVLTQSYEIKTTLNGTKKKVLRSERILTPIEASFRGEQVRLMKNFRDTFLEVGLEFTQVNDTSVLFHCIPYFLVAKEPNEKNTRRCQTAALIIEATVVDMCESIRVLGGVSLLEDEEGVRPLPRPLSHVMNTIACRSAIKFGDELCLTECEALISNLMECKLPFQCAHGRPSLIPIVDLHYLKFKKRVSKPNLKKLLLLI